MAIFHCYKELAKRVPMVIAVEGDVSLLEPSLS